MAVHRIYIRNNKKVVLQREQTLATAILINEDQKVFPKMIKIYT